MAVWLVGWELKSRGMLKVFDLGLDRKFTQNSIRGGNLGNRAKLWAVVGSSAWATQGFVDRSDFLGISYLRDPLLKCGLSVARDT